MLINEKHTKQFATFYLLCFVIHFGWLWFNNLLFSLVNPVFFLNKLDFTRNLLMLGNVQHYLISNYFLRVCFDLLYGALPILLTIAVIRNWRGKPVIAICTAAFTLIYGIFFSAVTYISIEGYISWILIPLIFSAATVKGFYYFLHAIRIIFILIFVSAAVAKISTLAVFNTQQMAGILLSQHKVYLVSNANDWFTKFIYFLVRHKETAFLFFILGTLAELSFAVGIFTRRFDRFLILVFCLFLMFDFFLMRINYFTWMVFMGCFYFSTFPLQDRK